jgi:hypothetical protein
MAMQSRSPKILTLMAFTAAAWIVPSWGAMSQPAPAAAHPIPQSLRVEHDETLERLSILVKRPGQVGVEARKAMEVFKRHAAREEEFILPPLTLLPVLADGKVTPDMAWAIAMTDRVRTEREQIFQEHTKLTDVLNTLVVAARRARDKDATEFAQAAAADSLNDLELLEPTVLLIGDYLRGKLAAGR